MTITHTSLRAVAARRPVLSYLVLAFAIAWAFLMPPAVAGSDDLVLFVIPASWLGLLGAALLVTALAEGRAGVRALLRRAFRWRVHPVWYAVAVFGLPVVALAGATLVRGPDAVSTLLDHPDTALAFVAGLAVVPLINLAEETGWMGFVQTRLQTRHGALAAAVLTAPLFALLHLPLHVNDPVPELLVNMASLVLLSVPFRIVVGWLHNRSGGSVLIAAIFHASFNTATSSVLLAGLVPGVEAVTVTAVALVVGAAGVLVATRGRLVADRLRPRVIVEQQRRPGIAE